MTYKLRFVQRIKKEEQELFLQLEQQFVQLEQSDPQMPVGRRFLPVTGKEPSNTLIWEAEFPSWELATSALRAIEENEMHGALLERQIRCMGDTYTEIYRELDQLGTGEEERWRF